MNTFDQPRRFGQIIRVKPEMLDEYKKLHAEPWPCVLQKIKECNIRNYSIYLYKDLLFATFEYVGKDYEKDMASMAEDECTKLWWQQTAPCQESLAGPGAQWWLDMEELFHTD